MFVTSSPIRSFFRATPFCVLSSAMYVCMHLAEYIEYNEVAILRQVIQ
jgi:hypothetical protein